MSPNPKAYPEILKDMNVVEALISMGQSDTSENSPAGVDQILLSMRPRLTSISTENEEDKYVGSYSPVARKLRIERFLAKRKLRKWRRKVDYDVRKNFADTRLRVKGRFVKKEDEAFLCQLLQLL